MCRRLQGIAEYGYDYVGDIDVGDEVKLCRKSVCLVEQGTAKLCGDVEVERHAFCVSVLLQNPRKKPPLPIG